MGSISLLSHFTTIRNHKQGNLELLGALADISMLMTEIGQLGVDGEMYVEMGIRSLARRWGVADSRARTILNSLEEFKTITRKSAGSRGTFRYNIVNPRSPIAEKMVEGTVIRKPESIKPTPIFSKAFEEAWRVYPRKLPHSKRDAWALWQWWLGKGGLGEEFLSLAVLYFSKYHIALETGQQFIPHMRTFLSKKARHVVDVNWKEAFEMVEAEKKKKGKDEKEKAAPDMGFDPSKVE